MLEGEAEVAARSLVVGVALGRLREVLKQEDLAGLQTDGRRRD